MRSVDFELSPEMTIKLWQCEMCCKTANVCDKPEVVVAAIATYKNVNIALMWMPNAEPEVVKYRWLATEKTVLTILSSWSA